MWPLAHCKASQGPILISGTLTDRWPRWAPGRAAALYWACRAPAVRTALLRFTFLLQPHFKCHQPCVYVTGFAFSCLFHLLPRLSTQEHFFWSSAALSPCRVEQSFRKILSFEKFCILCFVQFSIHHHSSSQVRFQVMCFVSLIILYLALNARNLVIFSSSLNEWTE